MFQQLGQSTGLPIVRYREEVCCGREKAERPWICKLYSSRENQVSWSKKGQLGQLSPCSWEVKARAVRPDQPVTGIGREGLKSRTVPAALQDLRTTIVNNANNCYCCLWLASQFASYALFHVTSPVRQKHWNLSSPFD